MILLYFLKTFENTIFKVIQVILSDNKIFINYVNQDKVDLQHFYVF